MVAVKLGVSLFVPSVKVVADLYEFANVTESAIGLTKFLEIVEDKDPNALGGVYTL